MSAELAKAVSCLALAARRIKCVKIAIEEFRINSSMVFATRAAAIELRDEHGPTIGRKGLGTDRGKWRQLWRTRDMNLVSGIGGAP